MARIKNNPLLKGVSGMLGDVVVFSERHGKMIMSNRPKKREEPTDRQKLVKSKFLQAVQYAKGQMAQEHTKAEYQAGVNENLISAYSVAVADYLKGPEILSIDAKGYHGQPGDIIEVFAIDNFKVSAVSVEIKSATGQLLEQGIATPSADNKLMWTYRATQLNNQLEGTKVIVRAEDKPGNVTIRPFTIPADVI